MFVLSLKNQMKWNQSTIHEELLYLHFTVKENNNYRSSVFLWIRRKKVLNEFSISKTERIKRTQKISQEITWKHTHTHTKKTSKTNINLRKESRMIISERMRNKHGEMSNKKGYLLVSNFPIWKINVALYQNNANKNNIEIDNKR